jgi:cupin 2 domain-containing protein
MPNIFDDLPTAVPDEVLTDLLAHQRARIERIVSNGQATPEDAPYDQDHDEWVLLLRGAAGLWLEGEAERTLRPGDYVFHRVTWTACGEPTSGSPCIWRTEVDTEQGGWNDSSRQRTRDG